MTSPIQFDRLTLITRDANITDSGVVDTLW